MANDHLVLIVGKSISGKSHALIGLDNPEGVMYLNCENSKRLPFKSKFKEYTIIDPVQIYTAFEKAEQNPDIHTVVVDTLTYMMDMFETVHINNATNTLQAWGNYSKFFKTLMFQYVAVSTKNVIFLAHTADVLNEKEMINETLVKVKGSLMNQGIESFFTTVVSTKKLPLNKLKEYKNEYLTINEDEEILGYKHVFQTRLTKETVNERIRSGLGMWDRNETYIDNNVQLVINRLHEYYGD